MRIDFYHLLRSTTDQVVPLLAEKVAGLNKRLLICTALPEQAAHLETLLWTYSPDSFLAHGLSGEGFENDQPVLISTDGVNLNGADFIMLTDGGNLKDLLPYERCFNLFDGNDASSVEAARALWKEAVENGCEARYWAQDETGKWIMKAAKNTAP